jgi:tRNA-dihydrouridine synthase B
VRIGPYFLPSNLAVAPMAGVTDRPFRMLCKRLAAGYAVSEMVGCDPRLSNSEKSRRRIDHRGEVAPIAVQIAGADPRLLADAARYNVDCGAQIIDINMGPGEKGLQHGRRLGAAFERAARRGDRRRRCERGRRPGDAQNPHRTRAVCA